MRIRTRSSASAVHAVQKLSKAAAHPACLKSRESRWAFGSVRKRTEGGTFCVSGVVTRKHGVFREYM